MAAVVSVVVSLLAALVVTFNLGFDFGLGLGFAGSLAVAGVLSLTSLGVLAKVLIDEGKLRTPIGIEMFTMALIAELLVLLVVGSRWENMRRIRPRPGSSRWSGRSPASWW